MTTPTLLLSPSGSRDRSGALTPVISGAVRQVPGRFGPAWLVDEAATNLLVNPRAGVDLGGVNANGQTHTRLTGQTIAHPDGFALDTAVRATWVNGATAGYAQGMNGLPTPSGVGQPVTCQALIRAVGATIGKTGRMYAFSTGGPSASQSLTLVASVPLTGAWQLVSGSGTLDAAGHTDFALFFGVNGAQVGDILEITAVAVTDRPYRASYVDGSLGTGYAWSGTPHASRSTRTASRLSYTPPAGRQTITGSIAIRARRPAITTSSGEPWIWRWAPPAATPGDHLGARLGLNGQYVMTARTGNVDAITGAGTVGGHVVGTPYTHYMEWTATTVRIVSERGEQTVARTVAPYGATSPDPVAILFGQDGGGQFFGGEIESVLMFDRPLTAQQRATLFELPATWTWDLLIPRVYRATLIGRTAGAEWSVRYLLVDALNTPIDDVTRYISPGGVDLDPDKAVSGQLTVGIDRPFRLPPYASFLAPIVTIRPLDGRPEQTEQQGLYRMRRGPLDWVDDRDRGIVASGRFTLDDLTGSVRDARLGDVYNVAAGVRYTDAAKLILQEVSLPGGALLRVRFPDDPRTLPAPMTWVANDGRLKVAGDLLARIGCYTPLADGIGTLTSIYYRDFDRSSPDRVYTAGDDSEIIDRPKTDTDDSTLANQITVIQEDQDPAKRYRTVVEVTDPRSPIHKNRIGLRPRLEMVSQYADQAAVTAYAMRLAATWGSVAESIMLQTHLDLSHDPYGLFALDLSGASRPGDDREWIDGRWRVGGVRHDHAAGRMTVNGSRTQPFVLTAAGVAS